MTDSPGAVPFVGLSSVVRHATPALFFAAQRLFCLRCCWRAAAWTGCPVVTQNVDSPAMAGRAMGGQQPVAGATISVIAMGTSGYGSTGTILASVTTDSGGNFSFAPGAYTCPQSDTPVYLLGIGGDSGAGENSSVVLGAGLGTCASGKNAFVIMNEVTTVGLAFTLAHFFSPTLGGGNAENDWFGGPSTTSGGTVQYSKGLVNGQQCHDSDDGVQCHRRSQSDRHERFWNDLHRGVAEDQHDGEHPVVVR